MLSITIDSVSRFTIIRIIVVIIIIIIIIITIVSLSIIISSSSGSYINSILSPSLS